MRRDTQSIGVALSSLMDDENPDLLLRNADIAMYNAKFKEGIEHTVTY